MRRTTTIPEIRAAVAERRASGRTIGLVPTMGALHDGHLTLVRRAAAEADDVVVSIFVNPRQFDRADDLAAYPRDLAADEELLANLGAATPAIVFAPDVEQMYPVEPAITVTVGGGLADRLCGATRPGHFDGVATVVTKLFTQVAPDVAVFGRKDRQQLQIIRRLVADLDLPVRIVGVETIRDPDGVAVSSRNRRLSEADRLRARVLPRALAATVRRSREVHASGVALRLADLRSDLAAEVAKEPTVRPDYLEVVDPVTLAPPADEVATPARLIVAVAAFVGPVRLIDNVELGDREDEDALLSKVRS